MPKTIMTSLIAVMMSCFMYYAPSVALADALPEELVPTQVSMIVTDETRTQHYYPANGLMSSPGPGESKRLHELLAGSNCEKAQCAKDEAMWKTAHDRWRKLNGECKELEMEGHRIKAPTGRGSFISREERRKKEEEKNKRRAHVLKVCNSVSEARTSLRGAGDRLRQCILSCKDGDHAG